MKNHTVAVPAAIAAFVLASCVSKPVLQETHVLQDGVSAAEANEEDDEKIVEQAGEQEFWEALHKSDMETVKRLIAEGYDFRKNKRGSILIHIMGNYRIYKPTPEIIRFFMEAGEDIDKLNGYNRSGALAEAIENDDFDIVRLALENGANPNWHDTSHEGNALHYAAEYAKDIRIFEALLEHGADINLQDNEGRTPIMYALRPSAFYYEEKVRTPDLEVLSLLIRSGADLLTVNKYGHDTMMDALVQKTNAETIHFVWNAIAERHPERLQDPEYLAHLIVRTRNDEFLATLAAAVSQLPIEQPTRLSQESDKAHLLRKLLNAGVEVDSRDARGRTLLTISCSFPDVVKTPLDGNETDPWRQNNMGEPDTGILHTLVSSGADVNARDNYGWTPLLLAAGNAGSEVIDYLLRNGADVNTRSDCGCTALHRAAEYNHDLHVALKLIRAGADIDAVNENGETPLICAAANYRNRSLDLAWHLFKIGADIHAQDKYGRTILTMILQKNPPPSDFFLELLDADADLKLTPEERTEIVRQALRRNFGEERIWKLLRRGIDFKQGDILQQAIDESSREIVEFLLEKDPVIDLKRGRWDATLVKALNRNDMRVANFLLKAGVKIPPKNHFNLDHPLLPLALIDGALTPELLTLFHEADPAWLKSTDGANRNLLMIAAENQSDPKVIITLLKLGADPNARTWREERTALAYLRDNPKLRHTPAFDALLKAIK